MVCFASAGSVKNKKAFAGEKQSGTRQWRANQSPGVKWDCGSDD